MAHSWILLYRLFCVQNQKTQFRICKNSVPKNFQKLGLFVADRLFAADGLFAAAKLFTADGLLAAEGLFAADGFRG